MVSVKTATDIPKGKIFEVMSEILKTHTQAPISIGDVVIHDVANTNVDVIATRNVLKNKLNNPSSLKLEGFLYPR